MTQQALSAMIEEARGRRILHCRELAKQLTEFRGATFLSMITLTDPRMVKKHRQTKEPNPYLGCMKRSYVNVLVNFWYEKAVLKRLAAEGKDPVVFRRGESWHEIVFGEGGRLTPLCRHKKACDDRGDPILYLRAMPLHVYVTEYVRPSGLLVDPELVDPYLPPEREATNQGLDREVKVRTYRLEDIQAITLGGETFGVVP